MTTPTSLVDKGTIREERMPEDNLRGVKMTDVTDSTQKLSDTQYWKVEEGSNGLGEVTASVILDSDCMWNAYVGDKKVPDMCDVLARFRSSPLTDDKLSDVIDNAVLCLGNQSEKFVSACKDKGGCMRGARGNGG